MTPRVVETHCAGETRALGASLAQSARPGTVYALYGEIGAGKTQLVQGMARALGIREWAHSPTFVLVHEYGGDPPLFHLDLYRMGSRDELVDMGLDELLTGSGIYAVEWAERAEGLLPHDAIAVRIEHAGSDTRRITIGDAKVS